MSFFTNLFYKSLAENEKNLRFWENYVQNLKSLDLSSYSDKLKVPVLVPIGSRILFRGDLKHTNEVTVALGADYFAKCSLKQAEEIRQHRIKNAESKLESFRKEREYLEKQLSFSKENLFEREGQEIIEVYTEEEDKAWREKHRENVRQWKVQKKTEEINHEEVTDEDLWNRLEELELQEELENELNKQGNVNTKHDQETLIIKEENMLDKRSKTNNKIEIDNKDSVIEDLQTAEQENQNEDRETRNDKKVKFIEPDSFKPPSKFELLQKVINKQNELEEKLMELRNKERSKSKTEQDLIAKLDEMEEFEDLQDEMDRIEDIIETEEIESEQSEDDNSNTSQVPDLKRRVSFADEDDSETLELNFYHSDVEPFKESYNPEKGIQKPSDIYQAFSHLFTETTSILKKTKFEDKNGDFQLPKTEKKKISLPEKTTVENKTIEVKDVVERTNVSDSKLLDGKRPVSLFKQKRQQKKS